MTLRIVTALKEENEEEQSREKDAERNHKKDHKAHSGTRQSIRVHDDVQQCDRFPLTLGSNIKMHSELSYIPNPFLQVIPKHQCHEYVQV